MTLEGLMVDCRACDGTGWRQQPENGCAICAMTGALPLAAVAHSVEEAVEKGWRVFQLVRQDVVP